MTHDLLRSLDESRVFQPVLSTGSLSALHVPFDALTGQRRYEARLVTLGAHPARISRHPVGPTADRACLFDTDGDGSLGNGDGSLGRSAPDRRMKRVLPMQNRLSIALAAATLSLALVGTGCSSDTADNAEDTVESASEDIEAGAEQATARATAESFRASLKANQDADEQGLRSVEVLQQVADDLPGDPDISGIEDGDGDGMDDDGKVEVTAGDEKACVIIPETGTDTEVTNEAC